MINKEDYCEFCDGIAKPTLVKRTFERHGQKFEYENIPALVCNKCGETYFDGVAIEKIGAEIIQARSGRDAMPIKNNQVSLTAEDKADIRAARRARKGDLIDWEDVKKQNFLDNE